MKRSTIKFVFICFKLAIIIVNHNVEICNERANKIDFQRYIFNYLNNKKKLFYSKLWGSAQDNGGKGNSITPVAIGGSLGVVFVVIVAGVVIVCRK